MGSWANEATSYALLISDNKMLKTSDQNWRRLQMENTAALNIQESKYYSQLSK